jgi:hypothetical protein
VALAGAHATEQSGFVGTEVDEMDVCVRVLVIEAGGADDVAVLLLQGTAGDYNAFGAVFEGYESLVAEEDEPVPAVFVVQGNTSSHLVNVRFGVELVKLVCRHFWSQRVADLISLNVVKTITLGKVLCNSALAASCWSSDDENVVVICDGHGL